MAILNLPGSTQIPNDGITLFRYLNKTKFNYLLQGKLYLTRVDEFKIDNDGHEIEPLYNYRDTISVTNFLYKYLIEINQEKLSSKEVDNRTLMEAAIKNVKETCIHLDETKKYTFISCFTTDASFLNRRFWEDYTKLNRSNLTYDEEDFGVLIKTNSLIIKNTIKDFEFDLYFSYVKYENPIHVSFMGNRVNSAACYLSKPSKSVWEKEVRILYQDNSKMHATTFDDYVDINISIPINVFIDEVILSPFNNSKQNESAIKLCNEYGLKYSIQKMELSFQDHKKMGLL